MKLCVLVDPPGGGGEAHVIASVVLEGLVGLDEVASLRLLMPVHGRQEGGCDIREFLKVAKAPPPPQSAPSCGGGREAVMRAEVEVAAEEEDADEDADAGDDAADVTRSRGETHLPRGSKSQKVGSDEGGRQGCCAEGGVLPSRLLLSGPVDRRLPTQAPTGDRRKKPSVRTSSSGIETQSGGAGPFIQYLKPPGLKRGREESDEHPAVDPSHLEPSPHHSLQQIPSFLAFPSSATGSKVASLYARYQSPAPSIQQQQQRSSSLAPQKGQQRQQQPSCDDLPAERTDVSSGTEARDAIAAEARVCREGGRRSGVGPQEDGIWAAACDDDLDDDDGLLPSFDLLGQSACPSLPAAPQPPMAPPQRRPLGLPAMQAPLRKPGSSPQAREVHKAPAGHGISAGGFPAASDRARHAPAALTKTLGAAMQRLNGLAAPQRMQRQQEPRLWGSDALGDDDDGDDDDGCSRADPEADSGAAPSLLWNRLGSDAGREGGQSQLGGTQRRHGAVLEGLSGASARAAASGRHLMASVSVDPRTAAMEMFEAPLSAQSGPSNRPLRKNPPLQSSVFGVAASSAADTSQNDPGDMMGFGTSRGSPDQQGIEARLFRAMARSSLLIGESNRGLLGGIHPVDPARRSNRGLLGGIDSGTSLMEEGAKLPPRVGHGWSEYVDPEPDDDVASQGQQSMRHRLHLSLQQMQSQKRAGSRKWGEAAMDGGCMGSSSAAGPRGAEASLPPWERSKGLGGGLVAGRELMSGRSFVDLGAGEADRLCQAVAAPRSFAASLGAENAGDKLLAAKRHQADTGAADVSPPREGPRVEPVPEVVCPPEGPPPPSGTGNRQSPPTGIPVEPSKAPSDASAEDDGDDDDDGSGFFSALSFLR